MDYRLDKQVLLDILGQWNHFLKRKVHLVACGGTAMTLMGVKPSTKDVDFMVPVLAEYAYLLKTLEQLGYRQVTGNGWQRQEEVFRFDLFRGNRIHTTELLESPLGAGRHQLVMEFSRLYVGVLNDYDLIGSKLMRGSQVDFEDCLVLMRARREQIDVGNLVTHFRELASYDVGEMRVRMHIDRFVECLREEGLYDG
jgi:hypothetical protein